MHSVDQLVADVADEVKAGFFFTAKLVIQVSPYLKIIFFMCYHFILISDKTE